jgi:tetratricopeptide (TPR) repeat protein/tRNA A-37 threonylcarbamoyl transferase component Bud32
MNQTQPGERTWIDQAADQFESAWNQTGDRPHIESFLAQEAGPRRALLLKELLRVECELRKSAGETPGPHEYRQRFPDDRAAVDSVFGNEILVHPAGKPPAGAAQSLLFGVLALQNNFIDRETLLAAFNAWVADKSQALSQILVNKGALSTARHALLEGLVQEHLEHHGFDPERSLAGVTVTLSVRDSLEEIADIDLRDSLINLCLANDAGEETDATNDPDWDIESAATDSEGRFRIVRFHDRGALGEVYVARDEQLHRIVALKRIKVDHAVDRDKCARFIVEAEITGRLEHPGIVPVYGLGTYDDGRPFYAMRFIRGDNLKAAIEQFHQAQDKGPSPGERNLALLKLLRRFLDVCNAIDYAHSRGVLHRDLKPGNIMLGKFGETLVVDWGLAKSVGRPEPVPASASLDDRTLVPQSGSDLRGTELGARLGTPAYMSPEQAAGRIDELGPASDVYSLGATLYCLLTGRAPYIDSDLAELLRRVERGDFTPPRKLEPWIDPALEAICKKAMANEPTERYLTPRALADDVDHWLADEPVSAWREPVQRLVRRWGRRHRLLVTSLGATLIVAVGALGIGNFLVARQRDRAEQSLAFARSVVDEMYTGVAEKLEAGKHMDDYQREILEKALAFYESFALPQSSDQRVKFEAARASERMAKIRSRLGDIAEAERADRKALEILGSLVADFPANTVYRDAIAKVHRDIAGLFVDQEHWPEAEQSLNEAIAIWTGLSQQDPGRSSYQSNLSRTHASLANLYYVEMRGRVKEAEAEYQKALALADRVIRDNPDLAAHQEAIVRILGSYQGLQFGQGNLAGSKTSCLRALLVAEALAGKNPEATRYQSLLANALRNRAGIFVAERDFVHAEEVLNRVISIYEKLASDHPQDLDIADMVGRSYSGMASLYLFKGDKQSSLEWADRKIRLYRSLVHRNPRMLSLIREGLCNGLAERAETFARLGRHAEALPLYDEVIGLCEGQKSQELMRAFRALTEARLGDLGALARQGDEVRQTVKLAAGIQGSSVYNTFWMTFYDAACIHAALARLILDDPGKPAAESRRLAHADLECALYLLEQARSTDEFKEMIGIGEIRRETLLDPLRTSPRFQLLMMDLVFPDNPFSGEGKQR